MQSRDRILVIDDGHVHLGMAEEIISEQFDVMLASSGDQALSILNDGEIADLILLDIDMPGMDGYKTFNKLREIEAVDDVPVVFLTGMTSSEAELAVLNLGAQDFITKPFTKENLLARIRLRLDESRRLREMKARLSTAGIDDNKFNSVTAGLTPTEREAARLIAQGCSNREIAERLNYTAGYVKNLATSIYDKLSVQNRQELRTLFRS